MRCSLQLQHISNWVINFKRRQMKKRKRQTSVNVEIKWCYCRRCIYLSLLGHYYTSIVTLGEWDRQTNSTLIANSIEYLPMGMNERENYVKNSNNWVDLMPYATLQFFNRCNSGWLRKYFLKWCFSMNFYLKLNFHLIKFQNLVLASQILQFIKSQLLKQFQIF